MNNVSQKKVSVVTVCIDLIDQRREEYFRQMFGSVLSQSYENIEHVIIDGNSQDGTVEFIKDLTKDASNITFISEPDTGIYNAMNKGIKAASGEYIVIMNSDDYYIDNTAIESLVCALNESEGDFACANAILERPKRDIIQLADLSVYPCAMPFCHQTLLCKKCLFDVFGYFDEAYRISADYKFIIKILKSKVKGAIVNKELVFFRYAGESALDDTVIMHEIEEILQENVYNKEPVIRKHAGEIYNKYVNGSCSILLILKIMLYTRDGKLKKILLKYLASSKHLKAWISNILRFRFIIKPIEKMIKKNGTR